MTPPKTEKKVTKTVFKKNYFSSITKGIRNGSVGNGKKIDSIKDIK